MANIKRHSAKRQKKILIFIAAALILTAGLLLFLFKDELFPSVAGSPDNAISPGEPFSFENSTNQSFALMEDYLSIASSTGLQLLDEDGNTVSREVFSMDEPCVSAGGNTCVFYDIGGTSLRAFFNKKYIEMDTEENIISADVNSSGFLALTTEQFGYKGGVTVFNRQGEEIYKWYSGSAYTLSSTVSTDCKRLAVLCLEESGSIIRLFELDREEEYASLMLPGELAYDIGCGDGGGVYVLSNDSLNFIDKSGKLDKTFLFDDNYLVDYVLSEGYCVIALSKYISGSEATLISFSASGKELGRADFFDSINNISLQKSRLLVFGNAGLRLFSRELQPLKEILGGSGYKAALLMPDSSVLLLASHRGEKTTFK